MESTPLRVGCQPATLIGMTEAPGATPWIPPGPPEPASTPASSVPCLSTSVRFCGSSLGGRRSRPADDVDALLDPVAEIRVLEVDAGVEQRDRDPGPIVARQRDPGEPRPLLPRRSGGSSPDTRLERERRRRPPGCARAAAGRAGRAPPRSRRSRARSCSRASWPDRAGRAESVPAAARQTPRRPTGAPLPRSRAWPSRRAERPTGLAARRSSGLRVAGPPGVSPRDRSTTRAGAPRRTSQWAATSERSARPRRRSPRERRGPRAQSADANASSARYSGGGTAPV